ELVFQLRARGLCAEPPDSVGHPHIGMQRRAVEDGLVGIELPDHAVRVRGATAVTDSRLVLPPQGATESEAFPALGGENVVREQVPAPFALIGSELAFL